MPMGLLTLSDAIHIFLHPTALPYVLLPTPFYDHRVCSRCGHAQFMTGYIGEGGRSSSCSFGDVIDGALPNRVKSSIYFLNVLVEKD